MTVSNLLDTDLITPLGAYLHLRENGRASFLLESVEQGRLGRCSLVGCGSCLPGGRPPRRRVPDCPLAGGGAANGRLGPRALPRAAPRHPLALPLPARARRARARRLLPRDAREMRWLTSLAEPDRGVDEPR